MERALDWLVLSAEKPELPLKICDKVGFNQLGTLGPLIASCPTIRDAVNLFRTYKNLLHPLFDLDTVEGPSHLEIVYVVDRERELNHYYAETVIGGLPAWFKRLTGKALEPSLVKFRHPKPDHSQVYFDHFQCEVLFDQHVDSIICASDKLDYPCRSASPKYHSVMMDKAKDQIQTKQSIVELVSSLFKKHLPKQLSFAELAEHLNTSERSLQRRLLDEGTNYKQLKQTLLKNEAIVLLETTNLNIEQIAYRLGYEQRSSFASAFQRWTGKSTGSWRTR